MPYAKLNEVFVYLLSSLSLSLILSLPA